MLRFLLTIFFANALSAGFATTVEPPRVRYRITNRTASRLQTVVLLESDDQSFSRYDTAAVAQAIDNGELLIFSQHHEELKTYQKLLIISTDRQYETPVYLYKDRCTAYDLTIGPQGLILEETQYYRIRRVLLACLISLLITLALKGLLIRPFVGVFSRNGWLAFLAINAVSALVLEYADSRIDMRTGASMIDYRLQFILVISLIEWLAYGLLLTNRRRLFSIAIGVPLINLVWVYIGWLLIVFGQFLFAMC